MKLRPATPIVTEHTRGQAHAAPDARQRLMAPVRRFPSNYGASTAIIRGGQERAPETGRRAATQRRRAALYRAHHQADIVAGLAHLAIANLLAAYTPPATGGLRSFRAQQTQQANIMDLAVAHGVAHQVGHDFAGYGTQHPLAALLDLTAIPSGAVSVGARIPVALRAAREAEAAGRTAAAVSAIRRPVTALDVAPRLVPDATGARKLRVHGGEVQIHTQSPNPLTAVGEHALDRLSERVPHLPIMGAEARAARHIREQHAARLARLHSQAVPLERAARKIRGKRGTVTGREMAYTVIARYGHTGDQGAALVDKEIAQKVTAAANATGRARKQLRRRVELLQAARPHVLNPDTELMAAVNEGRPIANATTGSRIERGLLNADTADAAEARHIRLLHGAEHVPPTPSRLGKTTAAEDRAQAELDRVDKLLERSRQRLANPTFTGEQRKRLGIKSEALAQREVTLGEREKELRAQLSQTPRGTTEELKARHDAIEAHWNQLVDKYVGQSADSKVKGTAQEQKWINQHAGKSRKTGFFHFKNATDVYRQEAERQMLDVLEKNAHVPYVAKIKDRLAEAETLRKELDLRDARASASSGLADVPKGMLHPHLPTSEAALKEEIRRVSMERRGLEARAKSLPVGMPNTHGMREQLRGEEKHLRALTAEWNTPAAHVLEERAVLYRAMRAGSGAQKELAGAIGGHAGKQGLSLTGVEQLKARIDELTGHANEARGYPPDELVAQRKVVAELRSELRSAEAKRGHLVPGAEYPHALTAKGERVNPVGAGRHDYLLARRRAAAERLQRIQSAAAKRVTPTGLVGGHASHEPSMYHVAPRSQRENILREGLVDKVTGKGQVFLWGNSKDAKVYQKLVGGDVYEVNPAGLSLKSDPWWTEDPSRRARWAGPGESFVSHKPIPASAVFEEGKRPAQEIVKPGPLAFNTPDTTRAPLQASVRSKVGLNPPRDRVHASTGALYKQGRERVGPNVTIRDFLKEARHKDRTERAKLAEGFSRPYDPATYDPNHEVLFDPHAATPARELEHGVKNRVSAEKRQAGELPIEPSVDDVLSPAAWIRKLSDEHQAWADRVFPKTAAQAPMEHELGLRVVPKRIADAIAGPDFYRQEANPVVRLLDFSNTLNRAGLIYLNPAYAAVQGTGNLAFLAFQQGVFTATNIPRYVRRLKMLGPELRQRIDLEVGGGAAASLAHEGRGAGPLTHLADVQNLLADKYPRELAWLHEANRQGFRSPAEIEALLTDEKLRTQLNVVSDRAQQAMVKFSRAPTTTRKIIGRAIFIAPWLEGSTRWLGRTLLDRPITAAVAENIRERLIKDQQGALGRGKEMTGGFIPLGSAFTKGGLRVIPGANPDSLSPTGSGIGVLKAVGELAGLVKPPVHGDSRILGMVQPTLAAGLAAIHRQDPYSDYKYPKGRSQLSIFKEQLLGDTSHPAFPLASTVVTAFRGAPNLKGAKPDKLPTYYPEHGVMKTVNVLGHHVPLPIGDVPKRLAFGSARERLVIDKSVQARAFKYDKTNATGTEKTRLMMQQAQMDGRKLGNTLLVGARNHGLVGKNEQLPAELRQALKLRTSRYVNYERVGAKTQTDKFKADVGQLLKTGKIDHAKAAEALAWLATKPSKRAIEHQRDLIGTAFYGSGAIAGARRQIHQAAEGGH